MNSAMSLSTASGNKFTMGQNGTVSVSNPTTSAQVGDDTVTVSQSNLYGIKSDGWNSVQLLMGNTVTVKKDDGVNMAAAGETSAVTIDVHPGNIALTVFVFEIGPVLIQKFVTNPGYTY